MDLSLDRMLNDDDDDDKVAMLCSVALLYYVFNCITETIQVTEDHMLPRLAQDNKLC